MDRAFVLLWQCVAELSILILALESAVDLDDLTVDEGRIVSCKEQSYGSDVLGLAYSLYRAVVDHSLQNCGAADAVYHCGVDSSRSDGVDPDLRTKLPCHGLGKTCHSVLGGNVGSKAVVSSEGSDGSDVYDDALALGLHDGRYELAKLKSGVHVYSEDLVPLFDAHVLEGGHAEHSGVVDENVHGAVSFNCLLNYLIAEREIGSICRKAAKHFVETGRKSVKVDAKNVEGYLGPRKILPEETETV